MSCIGPPISTNTSSRAQTMVPAAMRDDRVATVPSQASIAMIEFLMIPGAPTPVAPFSHAVATDGWLFVTGQMPTDPKDDAAPLPEGIEAQTRRVMDNLKLVLAGTGGRVESVGFARVYLTHFQRDYAPMNEN